MADGSAQHELRTYDMFHRLTGVRDNGGAVWVYRYDMLGNRISASDPDPGDWTYEYDAAGRLVEQNDARGAVTAMSYDQLGRLLKRWAVVPPSGQAMPADPALVQNTYDEAQTGYFNIGQLTTAQNASAKHVIDYNAAGSEQIRQHADRRRAWHKDHGHRPFAQADLRRLRAGPAGRGRLGRRQMDLHRQRPAGFHSRLHRLDRIRGRRPDQEDHLRQWRGHRVHLFADAPLADPGEDGQGESWSCSTTSMSATLAGRITDHRRRHQASDATGPTLTTISTG